MIVGRCLVSLELTLSLAQPVPLDPTCLPVQAPRALVPDSEREGALLRKRRLSTEQKHMEYCDLTDKAFKIAIMKKFNKLQENSRRQFNKPRNK